MASVESTSQNRASEGEPFAPELICATMILDPELAERIREQRAERGGDRFDEVWEGVYMMSPLANIEHQVLATRLTAVLQMAMGLEFKGTILAGANVSDRERGWARNYRCPDVVVYMPDSQAINRRTFWQGGPDLGVEIVSKHDRSREKVDFYAKVGTRELMFVDRDPWRLELLRLEGGALENVGSSSVDGGEELVSSVLPFSFALVEGEARPAILVKHTDSDQSWRV